MTPEETNSWTQSRLGTAFIAPLSRSMQLRLGTYPVAK
ncbi:hypothetical protein Y88_1870 [Novosphingobium nitrogenifigens DSM 19370]|uniref:Uncharacterized protein n=1 Tax=Novosphingobium nitrogenifigens DSM 19370 TaxID=983920 RepID=F1Z531_9SPHN|nr:hypothetical protein Y88_1870 [Novosphingobium nitrogenifigens DSM 19370]